MRDRIRATLICSVSVVLLGTLAACTRSAPPASATFETPARVAQVTPGEDMPEVVITASRAENVVAGEETARRL